MIKDGRDTMGKLCYVMGAHFNLFKKLEIKDPNVRSFNLKNI